MTEEHEILRVVRNHDASYYMLDEGCHVCLQQYRMDGEVVKLTEEMDVNFPDGAYVFPNTVPSTILSIIMEPDYSRAASRKMTLYSMGLITPGPNGELPLYRYCHDLIDGKIE